MLLSKQIAQARENLARIQEQFKDDPELLAVYEPSAKQFVEFLESEISVYGKDCRDGNCEN